LLSLPSRRVPRRAVRSGLSPSPEDEVRHRHESCGVDHCHCCGPHRFPASDLACRAPLDVDECRHPEGAVNNCRSDQQPAGAFAEIAPPFGHDSLRVDDRDGGCSHPIPPGGFPCSLSSGQPRPPGQPRRSAGRSRPGWRWRPGPDALVPLAGKSPRRVPAPRSVRHWPPPSSWDGTGASCVPPWASLGSRDPQRCLNWCR
jgi:hypothetical protein